MQLEYILLEYLDYPSYIKQVEEELLNPHTVDVDENIGGGRGSHLSNPTERIALSIVDDKRLNRIQAQQQAVDKVYQESLPKTQEIIREYYWQRPRTKTWDGVAKQVNYSRRQCHNLRNDFFDRLADELGMMR